MEFWKYGSDYKFYTEDIKERNELLKIKGVRLSGKYSLSQGKIIGWDCIVPANRFEFSKNRLKQLKLKMHKN